MANQSLGSLIRDLREQAYLSQEELAARAQVSRATIQNAENDRRAPRRAVVRRIAAALGVDVAVLQAAAAGAETSDVPSDSTESVEELKQLIADTEDELKWLNPKYESTRASLTAHLQQRIAILQSRLDALQARE